MVIRRSLFLLFILMIVLAFVAPAAASFNLDVTVTEQGEPIPAGESGELEVTIAATSSQTMLCASGGTFDVDVAVEDADAEIGFAGDVSPATVTFSIEGGNAYGLAGQEAWTGEQTTSFMPQIGNDIPHATHTYTIRATYDGSQPGDCESAEGWSENDGSASVAVTGEEAEEEDPENETDDNGSDPDSEDGPAPGFGIVVLAAIIVVYLRRR